MSKDDFAAALRGHQAAVDAAKSPQREEAANSSRGQRERKCGSDLTNLNCIGGRGRIFIFLKGNVFQCLLETSYLSTQHHMLGAKLNVW